MRSRSDQAQSKEKLKHKKGKGKGKETRYISDKEAMYKFPRNGKIIEAHNKHADICVIIKKLISY